MSDPTLLRHEKYYYEDGSITVQCENTLFKIHRSRLASRSEHFETAIHLPEPKEGSDGHDSLPFKLPTWISSQDFAHLLTFLYDPLEASITYEYLMAVLDLSHLFVIPSGISYAMRHLPTHPKLTPERQLQLALRYDVYDWVAPAFAELLRRPQEDLTWSLAKVIGDYPCFRLFKARADIDLYKRNLAYWPPEPKTYIFCRTDYVCKEEWYRLWWNVFAKHILHPDNPTTLDNALTELRTRAEMCHDCRTKTVDHILDQATWDKLLRIEEQAVEKIIEWMKARAANVSFDEDDEYGTELGRQGDTNDTPMVTAN